MFGKKKYYIVTSDTEDMGLRMYFVGRMTKRQADKYMAELTAKFPVLWVMLTGVNLREVARNKIQIKDLKDISAGRQGAAIADLSTLLDVTPKKEPDLAN